MDERHPQQTTSLRYWLIGAVGAALLLFALTVLLAPLNQDEGWYLYAARAICKGQLPHRDFFFTQGLGHPLFYSAFAWAWGPHGILGGRILTALITLAGLVIADRALIKCLTQETPKTAARILLWSLLGLNLWFCTFTVIPKTYALCILLQAGLFLALATLKPAQRVPVLPLLLAGVLAALLPVTRLSMGILIPICCVWLISFRKHFGRKPLFLFSASAGITLLACFGPELLLWPKAFFETQAFHTAREPMGLLGTIGCAVRAVRFNPTAILLTLVCCNILMRPTQTRTFSPFSLLFGACALGIILVHLFTPVPYDDYLVPALLPFALAVILIIADHHETAHCLHTLAKFSLLFALILAVGASPLAQDWVMIRQDRFWVELKSEPDLLQLRRVGKELAIRARELKTDTLWTQDTYLAIEAKLSVPRGMEMGPFSKPQPLDSTPLLAAWSGYTYALHFPDLNPDPEAPEKIDALQRVYSRNRRTIPNFGQGHTTLTIAERALP